MKSFAFLIALTLTPIVGSTADLPFDRSIINRYSLDGLVRSISVRQGADVWLGYDLERAMLRKVWRAPEGKSGLSGRFTVKSVGKALFEDETDAGWGLVKDGKANGLEARYLGCTQSNRHFELSWELRHGNRRVKLRERISRFAGSDIAVWRELKVEGLEAGESLQLPAAVGAVWRTVGGRSVAALAGSQWIRIVIP